MSDLDDLTAFIEARLDEDEALAKSASGGTVVGEPGNWKPAPGGDEWEAHADLVDGDDGPDGDLEVLVALRPGLPRPPDVMGGYWGAVISWQADLCDPRAWAPEPQFRHMARHDPARVLRGVKAGRAIVNSYAAARKRYESGATMHDLAEDRNQAGTVFGLKCAVFELAAIWDGHPDYREEWAP